MDYTDLFWANMLFVISLIAVDTMGFHGKIIGRGIRAKIFNLWTNLSFLSIPPWLFYVMIT